jgi:hypothetical protein
MSKTLTNITGFNFDNPDIKTLIINTQVKDFKLFEQFMDISINDNGRDIIIKELYKRDPLLLNELYNNNIVSYIETPTASLKNNLYYLLRHPLIDFLKKIQILETIITYDSKSQSKTYENMIDLIYDVSSYNIIQQKELNVSTTVLFDTIKNMMKKQFVKQIFEKLTEQEITQQRLIQSFTNIFNSPYLNEDFKYKLFDSLKKDSNIIQNIKLVISKLLVLHSFINYQYNLYICQYLLENNHIQKQHLLHLVQIAKRDPESRKEENENCIADIADFLISEKIENYSSLDLKEFKQIGLQLFEAIKWDSSVKHKNIYNNKQNIHSINIDKTIKPFFDKLINMDFGEHLPANIDDDKIHELIEQILKMSRNIIEKNNMKLEMTKIERTIQRFILDNTVYTDKLVSLLQLLFRSYLYIIITNEGNEELLKRFVEELYEMADTCSTGHLVRLANIFSGYDVNMHMDVEDELKSCIFHRLTIIINSKTEEEQDKIYENTLSEEFMKILSKDLVGLINELEKEYVESKIISSVTLQELFRRYIGMFQTGEKV